MGVTGRPLFALKGRNKSAQGNALGNEAPSFTQALKGRNILARQFLLRPFRAREPEELPVPRALPWADLFQPLRLF